MSSDTMYFNSSRLLQSNSRNKTPAVKQKQNYAQPQKPLQQQQQEQQQQRKKNNNNNYKNKNHRPSSSSSSLHKKKSNTKKDIANDENSHATTQDSLEHRKFSNNSTKNTKKDDYPQVQQLPNGERPNFGNSHKSSHKNYNIGSNSHKNNKNHQRRSSSNGSGYSNNRSKGKNNDDEADKDVRSIIKTALNMHINSSSAVVSDEETEPHLQRKSSRTSSFGSSGKSRRASHRKSFNKFETHASEKENEDDSFGSPFTSAESNAKAPISPVSPMEKPMMAPPVFLAPPVSCGSPLVQPINHMVAMPPLQQHQQPAPPPPPPPQMSTQFAHAPQRGYPYHGAPAMGNPTMNGSPLPMHMPLAMPLKQAPSSPHPTFAMNSNSMMLHPAPPQLPQPHFMNMNQHQHHHHQNMGHTQHPMMPLNTNQGNYHYYPPQHTNRVVPMEAFHQNYNTQSSAASVSADKKSSNRNDKRSTDVDGEASSTSLNSIGSQYAGASFTINAPTITKLPKPSFV